MLTPGRHFGKASVNLAAVPGDASRGNIALRSAAADRLNPDCTIA
jgi:hypothetical protein